MTYGPLRAHLDLLKGCPYLLRTLWRVRPKLHVFGHIHEGAGVEWSGLCSVVYRLRMSISLLLGVAL
jgi:hypothetical protein